MVRVGIIDHNVGNFDSIARAVSHCGCEPVFITKKSDFNDIDKMILPGVGSYSAAMNNLYENNLLEIIKSTTVEQGIPLLGICLGMQLLFESSDEGGKKTEGLSLIPGEVVKFDKKDSNMKIPHVGWNAVNYCNKRGDKLLDSISEETDFYFVHSYHVDCDDQFILAKTHYFGEFNSIVRSKNMYGVQFHPEKSQKPGLKLLKNFLQL